MPPTNTTNEIISPDDVDATYLLATPTIDSDHPSIKEQVERLAPSRHRRPRESAIALFDFVRDQIRYDPYYPFYRREHYRASAILSDGRGYCVSKAALLCALARAAGIATRLGFADVRNHLATRQLIEMMGTDIFTWHGFVEFYLHGSWVKATPTFNAELCQRFDVAPLSFNGIDHAIFHQYNRSRHSFMRYLKFHGHFADIPLDQILTAWQSHYGRARVAQWIALHEGGNGFKPDAFDKEEPLDH
jgi:transglutaminase-like putative cysteine protease